MSLHLGLDGSGDLTIGSGRNVCVRQFEIAFGGSALRSAEGTLQASPWDRAVETDGAGARNVFRRTWLEDAVPIASVEVREDGDVAWFSVKTLRPLAGLAAADSFEVSNVAAPAFSFPSSLRVFAVTLGLGRSGEDSIGGYWPEASSGTGLAGLPGQEAFAPLVLFDGESALAIAPASQFLTSMLRRAGHGVARGVHGAIDHLEADTTIETVFAAGNNVADALARLGDALLRRGGKSRPSPSQSPLTSSLGWWNAYGGFYTEPIRPLGENRLIDVIDRLRRSSVPVAYVGLDLWYPYREIGQAVRFTPDPRKYAKGFRDMARRYGLAFVYHLSALSRDNEYGASGADPSFYADVATELRREGGIAAWHDWLRTQQHLTLALRSTGGAADEWFGGMASALAGQDLKLLLCMQTMGMVLAATTCPNVISARSAIDYLFGQPEALETLDSLGHGGFKRDAIHAGDLRRQNLLVGSVLNTLGLLPFHDLFLTRYHDGLGGASPKIEAALRALSCGPVGIGDGPGMTDLDLVRTLVSARGALLHPDHAPHPDTETLGDAVEIYRTECAAGEARWEYVVALNRSQRKAAVEVPHDGQDVVVWDVFGRRIVPAMEATLEPGDMAYYMLAPLRQGLAPMGFVDKVVPVPAGLLTSAEAGAGWRIELDAPGERFAFWSREPLRIRGESGKDLQTEHQADLWSVQVPGSVSSLVATRR
jgi:hypothetical protein